MVDGVRCSSTRVEGPMPQTRVRTRKALALGLKADQLVVNKIDRPGARPGWVIDQTFELFDKRVRAMSSSISPDLSHRRCRLGEHGLHRAPAGQHGAGGRLARHNLAYRPRSWRPRCCSRNLEVRGARERSQAAARSCHRHR